MMTIKDYQTYLENILKKSSENDSNSIDELVSRYYIVVELLEILNDESELCDLVYKKVNIRSSRKKFIISIVDCIIDIKLILFEDLKDDFKHTIEKIDRLIKFENKFIGGIK